MGISRILRHPFWLIILVFSLNTIPGLFLSYSYRYPSMSASLQTILLSVVSFVFLALIPLAIIKFLFREKLSAYGWRLPVDTHASRKLILSATLILLPVVIFLSTQSVFRAYYFRPYVTLFELLASGVVFTFLYFLSEEFLFHGFLFFGLWPRLGYHSFWIISVLFSLLHITKPPAEIVLSFFTSFIFCYLSLKTKSFLPAAIVHFFIAVILNALVMFA